MSHHNPYHRGGAHARSSHNVHPQRGARAADDGSGDHPGPHAERVGAGRHLSAAGDRSPGGACAARPGHQSPGRVAAPRRPGSPGTRRAMRLRAAGPVRTGAPGDRDDGSGSDHDRTGHRSVSALRHVPRAARPADADRRRAATAWGCRRSSRCRVRRRTRLRRLPACPNGCAWCRVAPIVCARRRRIPVRCSPHMRRRWSQRPTPRHLRRRTPHPGRP